MLIGVVIEQHQIGAVHGVTQESIATSGRPSDEEYGTCVTACLKERTNRVANNRY